MKCYINDVEGGGRIFVNLIYAAFLLFGVGLLLGGLLPEDKNGGLIAYGSFWLVIGFWAIYLIEKDNRDFCTNCGEKRFPEDRECPKCKQTY